MIYATKPCVASQPLFFFFFFFLFCFYSPYTPFHFLIIFISLYLFSLKFCFVIRALIHLHSTLDMWHMIDTDPKGLMVAMFFRIFLGSLLFFFFALLLGSIIPVFTTSVL